MLKISIAGRNYRVPTHWEDISLSRCAWLHKRVGELPPQVREYYLSFASDAGRKQPDDPAPLAAFAAEALEHLGGMPEGALRSVPEWGRLGDMLLPRFVCGVLGRVDYPPTGARAFRWHSRRYYYPAAGCDVMGRQTPLSGLCAAELCQVSDIVLSGNLALAPLALALCCRPRGERYDEARAQRRAAGWGDLPASVFWELWAQTSAAHEYLRECFPECYGKGSGEGRAAAGVWSDQLVALAVNTPSALTCLQTMNGYDFIHLLSESIKNKTEQWKMSAALSGLGAR